MISGKGAALFLGFVCLGMLPMLIAVALSLVVRKRWTK